MYEKLNLVKKIIKLPIVILVSPIFLVVLFFVTDWSSEDEIGYSKSFLKDFYW